MDNVKALGILKHSLEIRTNFHKLAFNDNIHPEMRAEVEAEKLALVALEKQIPKPVKYLNRHGDGADYWNKDYFNCPACGRRLRNKKPDPYCPRCGQALTWEVNV